MHEMAIMQGLFKMIDEQVELHQLKKVTKVKIVAGVMSGAVPDSLELCFEVMSQEGPCKGAELEIEQVPLRAVCASCAQEYEVQQMATMNCPQCEGKVGDFVAGKQIFLEYIEGD